MKKKCNLGAIVHIATPKKKKTMSFNKYSKGTKDIDAIATDAGDEILKQAQASTPKNNIRGTYNDETSFVGPTNKSQASYEGEKARESYEARLAGEKARTELESKSSTTPTVTKSTPANWNNKAEMDKVKAYQTRHGLKADGVWNEGGETDKFYKAQQAKKSTPSGSTRGAAVKSTTGTSVTPKKEEAKAIKGGSGNVYYSNGRAYDAKTGKMGNYTKNGNDYTITTKNDSKEHKGFKSAAPKGGETEDERVQRLMDTSSRIEGMGGLGSKEQVKIAQEIQPYEKEDDKQVMSLGKKVGLSVGATALLGAAVYGTHRKQKSLNKGMITKTAQDIADEAKFAKKADLAMSAAEGIKKPKGKVTKKMNLKTPAPEVEVKKTSTTTTPPVATSTKKAEEEAYRANRLAEAEKKAASAKKSGSSSKPRAGSAYATPEAIAYMKEKGITKRPSAAELKAHQESKVVTGHSGEAVTVLEPKVTKKAKASVATTSGKSGGEKAVISTSEINPATGKNYTKKEVQISKRRPPAGK